MNKFLKIVFFPITLVCFILLYLYKFVVSPLLPSTCRFYPTCSTYMVEAIKKFGPFKGIVLGTKRLLRCRPNKAGGFDPVPDNIKGEIKWLL